MNTEEFYDKIIKLAQTSVPQFKLVMNYGLRQIKYMFDVDKILDVPLPDNSVLVGLSVMGRFNAIDYENKIRYAYFMHNKTWSASTKWDNLTEFDSVEDFKAIYDLMGLKDYDLNDLTHVVSNFREEYTKWYDETYGVNK